MKQKRLGKDGGMKVCLFETIHWQKFQVTAMGIRKKIQL